MPYKISGTKSETARIIVINESDYSVESNTLVSGSGAYDIPVESGNKLVFARNEDGWVEGYGNVSAKYYTPPGSRGLFGGGYSDNTIDYVNISNLGDATDFGDLTVSPVSPAATSNGANDRGVWGGGGYPEYVAINVIGYVTITSIGDATDFGDLTVARRQISACSNGTNERGVFAGHETLTNVIDYITISSIGDAIDFGDLTVGRPNPGGCSNATNDRGVFAGGSGINVIDYITITSTGDATDFGDLTLARMFNSGCSNGTNERGVFGGGWVNVSGRTNVIDYITISTTADATDFGDLISIRDGHGTCSNGTSDRGLFGGGNIGSYVNSIEYITISSIGNSTDFGDLTVSTRNRLEATSNA